MRTLKRASLAITLLTPLALAGCATGGEGLLTTGDAAETTGSIGPAAKGDASAARDYWATAYAKNPHDEKAAIAFAHALKADGEKDKALSILEQASFYNPDSLTIAGEEGRAALDMGQADFAEKLLARANDPQHPDSRILNALGALEAKRGDRPKAEDYFIKAAQLSPGDANILNNLALCYVLDGDAPKAEGLLRKALATGGDTKRIRQNLALVLGVEGRHDEAQQLASADLSADDAKANRAYMEKMVAWTPVALGKPKKVNEQAILGAWRTQVSSNAQPTSQSPQQPVDSGANAWVVDVAAANAPQPAKIAAR